jgi:hypothetical protein
MLQVTDLQIHGLGYVDFGRQLLWTFKGVKGLDFGAFQP